MATARESAAAAAAGADEGGVCLASLKLLCAILSWDFSRAGEGEGGAARVGRKGCSACRPRALARSPASPCVRHPICRPRTCHLSCLSPAPCNRLHPFCESAVQRSKWAPASSAAVALDPQLARGREEASCVDTPPAPPRPAGGSNVWRLGEAGRPAEAVHVRPPPAWGEVLLAPGAFDWLEALMAATRQAEKRHFFSASRFPISSRPRVAAHPCILCACVKNQTKHRVDK